MNHSPRFLAARCTLALATLASSATLAQRPGVRSGADPLRGFDQYVARAMKDWKVPGLAIAVVKGDSMVFAQGYGVRRLGEPAAVDAQTLFAIGSASKAFTGAAMGTLVDERKVKWDDPVTQYLPYFQLYDPWVTRQITVRDLLTHRSGLSRGDQLWYGTTRSREDVVRGVRNLKPSWSMRTRFGYQNIMFITAGEVMRAASGKTWNDLVKERIFAPLGMTSSNTSVKDLAGQADVASPHAEIDDTVRPVPWRNIDNAGPAGSINSNVVDMARWIRLQLDGGQVGGKQVLSPATHKETITPQFVVNDPLFFALLGESNFLTYGFGWFIQDFRGRKFVNHGGNIDGMSALVGFLPEEKLGVVVLTNLNSTEITLGLMENLFDRYLGVSPPKDWSAEVRQRIQKFQAQGKEAQQKRVAARVPNTHPTLPLERYAGSYENELYGTTTVRLENGGLVVQYDPSPTTVGDLVHWHFDSFEARMRDPMLGKIPVTFELGADGKVAHMVFEVEGPVEWKRRAMTTTATNP